MIETVAFDRLAASFSGTGAVSGVTDVPEGTRVEVSFPGGRVIETVIPTRSDVRHVATRRSGALAVRLRVDELGIGCSVLASSPGGPMRVSLELADGLGLAALGVTTVAVRG